MDVKALQLLCRYSLPPNSLGYCGRDSAPEKFKTCVMGGKCVGIEEELSKFIVLNPYLRTLARITGFDPYSYEVAEAYWLGNDELKKANLGDYPTLTDNFKKQGVPEWLVEELSQKPPKVFIPSHLFQILHVGVGRASGSVPYNIDSINNCMVRWGNVKKLENGKAVVDLHSLKGSEGKYSTTLMEEEFPFIPGFVPNIKVGDVVCAHWKEVIKILEPGEVEKLDHWTNEVLESFS
ncbi:MAG: DUF6390 family protein [Patescibacteria group bacterium]|jgi:hypothetical protein